MKTGINLILAILMSSLVMATEPEQISPFESYDDSATLLVTNAQGHTVFVHNRDRANQRYSPASTFKIYNTLVALETSVVDGLDHVYRWDGKKRLRDVWNKDQTMRSAFQLSCVWCYQWIARDVGQSGYEKIFNRVPYGNNTLGEQIELFWLNGDLQISATEQIQLLREIQTGSIDFSNQSLQILRSAMFVEETGGYKLFAKSGWTGPELHTSWYVGWLENEDHVWLFAMNREAKTIEEAMLSKSITLTALTEFELIKSGFN